jgi:hypothetical protein
VVVGFLPKGVDAVPVLNFRGKLLQEDLLSTKILPLLSYIYHSPPEFKMYIELMSDWQLIVACVKT